MTAEENIVTRLRIEAYAEADKILDAEVTYAVPLSHEVLRRLLVMAYLEGYSNAGHLVLEMIAKAAEEAGR